jgi:hypothetical protein
MFRFRRIPIAWRSRLEAVRRFYVRYFCENTPEGRGLRLLRAWLSPSQLEQLDAKDHFDVIGCTTGRRYRIYYSTSMNVFELDDTGCIKTGLCFAPAARLVPGDVMLAQKIALETSEIRALSVAINFVPQRKTCDGRLILPVSSPAGWRGSSSVPLSSARSDRTSFERSASLGSNWFQSIATGAIRTADQSAGPR